MTESSDDELTSVEDIPAYIIRCFERGFSDDEFSVAEKACIVIGLSHPQTNKNSPKALFSLPHKECADILKIAAPEPPGATLSVAFFCRSGT